MEYTVGRPKPVEQREVETTPFGAAFKQSARFGFDPEEQRLLDDAPQLDG